MNKKFRVFLELVKISKKVQIILACSSLVVVGGTVYGVNVLNNKSEVGKNELKVEKETVLEESKNEITDLEQEQEKDVEEVVKEDLVDTTTDKDNKPSENTNNKPSNNINNKPSNKPNNSGSTGGSTGGANNSGSTGGSTGGSNNSGSTGGSIGGSNNGGSTGGSTGGSKPIEKPSIENGYNAEMTNYINSIILNRYSGVKASYFDDLLNSMANGSRSSSQVQSLINGTQWEENGPNFITGVTSATCQVLTGTSKDEVASQISRGNFRYWKAKSYYKDGRYVVALIGIVMHDIEIIE